MQNVRIVSGREVQEYVGPETMQSFAKILAKSIHDEPRILFARFRYALRALINGPLARVNRELPLDRLYPYHTDCEAVAGINKDIRKMLADRTLLTSIMNDHVAGIGGFMEVNRTPDDRPVIELRRTAFYPTARGGGLYQQLADARLKRIEEEHPDSLIMNATRQPSVIGWTLEKNFEEIDWREFYVRLKGASFAPHQERAFDDRVKRGRWRYFKRPASHAQRDH